MVNHSRQGNCDTKFITINKWPHLVLITNKDTEPSDKILYDYGERDKAAIAANPWLPADGSQLSVQRTEQDISCHTEDEDLGKEESKQTGAKPKKKITKTSKKGNKPPEVVDFEKSREESKQANGKSKNMGKKVQKENDNYAEGTYDSEA